jgi:hypothetical protein
MSNLAIHDLFQDKVQVASEMSIRELITAIGDSVSPISGLILVSIYFVPISYGQYVLTSC